MTKTMLLAPFVLMPALVISPAGGTIFFRGLPHTPLGDALLTIIGDPPEDVLEISNIGFSGEDGVSVGLGAARLWVAEMAIAYTGDSRAAMVLTAVGQRGGDPVQPISSMIIREVGDGTLAVSAVFDSPTYRLEIFDGDSLVFSMTGFPSSHLTSSHDMRTHADCKDCGDCLTHSFEENEDGECEWNQLITSTASPIHVIDPATGMDVAVVGGDRIRIVENLEDDHRETMIYTEQRIEAVRFSSIIMLDESVIPLGDEMVTICHIPPGNPANPHTITVSVNALAAHLAHGDTIGPCGGDDDPPASSSKG